MSLHSLCKSPIGQKWRIALLLTSPSKLEKLSLARLTQRLIMEWIHYLSECVWNLEAKMKLTKWLFWEPHASVVSTSLSSQYLTCLFWLPCCHLTDVFIIPCHSQTLLALPDDPTNPQCSISGALGREADGGVVHSATLGGRWRGS